MSPHRIGVVGLGYVGLPVAIAFGLRRHNVIGFDVNAEKVDLINKCQDPTREGLESELRSAQVKATTNPSELADCDVFIVAVPTPVDRNKRPDLSLLLGACETVGSVMKKGALVIFESTVYPGVTEEICGPALARASNMVQGRDFKLGYSPERINPGDKEHTFSRIVKVVAGEDPDTLETVAAVYQSVVDAGVFRAASIKVAEAAKVIENAQRDINIAFMNELALIFSRIGISTKDVLAAARTKWNFLPFTPGLVGGHCIGVDPYYLTTKAQEVGYHPQVILAGRRINDDMGSYVAQRFVKHLLAKGKSPSKSRVALLGVTFKENVADLRNSRIPDIYNELVEYGFSPTVSDPLVSSEECLEEYGFPLDPFNLTGEFTGVILAVPHRQFVSDEVQRAIRLALGTDGVLFDVKGALGPDIVPPGGAYLSL